MIGGRRVLALIPARGGSKTVAKKNLREFGGKPLIAWPIEVAQRTPEIDRILVSTDCDEIARAAEKLGAEVDRRPADLATDGALVADVVLELRQRLRAEGELPRYLVLLEPTAPLRRPEDIRRCLERLRCEALDSVATFSPARTNPMRAWRIAEGRAETFIPGAVPWTPRQQLPAAFELNGAVYAFELAKLERGSAGLLFGRTGAVVIEPQRAIDIDDEKDFVVADALLRSTPRA